ncbi:MAG: cytochrome c [Tistlia sp.]|uniref:cytochrome c n=1 Tax=Tistlia sp. TaxID=3057121 RepID=UPI0034A2C829
MGLPARLLPILLLLWPLATDVAAQEPPAEEEAVARGRYLLHAAGCVTCHTAEAEDAVPLAGGRALQTPFGTFRTPNLTPDPETGLGGWSAAQFRAALREGLAPDGSPYYPAFPYPSYAGMTEADADDLFAYLQSLTPVRNAVPDHDLDFPFSLRPGLWAWRWLHFDAAPFAPDPEQGEAWNRGAYLVEHLGHCGECHTPRNFAGATEEARRLAGNPQGPEGKRVPNITPHQEDGIGAWDATDMTFFLETGFLPDGDVAGGAMAPVIKDSTSRLTAEDRAAIAAYLLALPPLPDE